MELSQQLELEVKLESTNEFNNPTPDFGERIRVLIFNDNGESLPQDVVEMFNDWANLWLEPQYSWREFIHWVWNEIVKWWKSLWD